MIYKDSGLRYSKSGTTYKIACQDLAASHKLRFRKGATTVGLPLVATDADGASPIRLFDGTNTKCLGQYGDGEQQYVTDDCYIVDGDANNYDGGAVYASDSNFGSNPFDAFTRIYLKQPSSSLQYLNIYAFLMNPGSDFYIYAAGGSWDVSTINWANQPALGALLKTIAYTDIILNNWNKLDLGIDLTNGIVIKTDESDSEACYSFYSSENADNKPYWSSY